MTRRPGLTMTELLVAIFIVAIGLAGVMSMVPFGAKQMGDALVADRSTSHATTVDGLVRSEWHDKTEADSTTGIAPITNEPYYQALDNAASNGAHPNGTTLASVSASSSEPSYPVFLDPMGWTGRSSPDQNWVGDSSGTFVPRRTMNTVTTAGTLAQQQSLALRLWSQADGFTWDEDSKPSTNPAEMRELRYNALAVLQRPINANRNEATFKIVVFSNRKLGFNPPGSEALANGLSGVQFNPGQTFIPQLPVNAATAGLRKGSWVMDATINNSEVPPIRHANFYRIVSATQDATGAFWDLELHTPIVRGANATGTAYNGTLVVMPGVAAVFERPMLVGTTTN